MSIGREEIGRLLARELFSGNHCESLSRNGLWIRGFPAIASFAGIRNDLSISRLYPGWKNIFFDLANYFFDVREFSS